jgi:hypothetical protein
LLVVVAAADQKLVVAGVLVVLLPELDCPFLPALLTPLLLVLAVLAVFIQHLITITEPSGTTLFLVPLRQKVVGMVGEVAVGQKTVVAVGQAAAQEVFLPKQVVQRLIRHHKEMWVEIVLLM